MTYLEPLIFSVCLLGNKGCNKALEATYYQNKYDKHVQYFYEKNVDPEYYKYLATINTLAIEKKIIYTITF